jgi:hypothetical protein
MRSWKPLQSCKHLVHGALLMAAAALQPAAAVPVVSIAATPDPAVTGTPLALTVKIAGAVDLYTYQFSLAFNPAVLQATSVTEGSFLATGGVTFFGAGSINNGTGLISFTFDSLTGLVPGVSGNGNLVVLNFNVINPGTSALNFSDVLFLNSLGADVLPTVQNRSLQAVAAVPEPSHAALLLAGLLGLAAVSRSRSRNRSGNHTVSRFSGRNQPR